MHVLTSKGIYSLCQVRNANATNTNRLHFLFFYFVGVLSRFPIGVLPWLKYLVLGM